MFETHHHSAGKRLFLTSKDHREHLCNTCTSKRTKAPDVSSQVQEEPQQDEREKKYHIFKEGQRYYYAIPVSQLEKIPMTQEALVACHGVERRGEYLGVPLDRVMEIMGWPLQDQDESPNPEDAEEVSNVDDEEQPVEEGDTNVTTNIDLAEFSTLLEEAYDVAIELVHNHGTLQQEFKRLLKKSKSREKNLRKLVNMLIKMIIALGKEKGNGKSKKYIDSSSNSEESDGEEIHEYPVVAEAAPRDNSLVTDNDDEIYEFFRLQNKAWVAAVDVRKEHGKLKDELTQLREDMNACQQENDAMLMNQEEIDKEMEVMKADLEDSEEWIEELEKVVRGYRRVFRMLQRAQTIDNLEL